VTMYPFDKRLAQHDTNAFVVTTTVDGLAEKLLGIVGERRITLMRRYLGESGGEPRITTGLRLERGGYAGPITRRPTESVHVRLTNDARTWEGFGFGIHLASETEEQVAHRYRHPEEQWMGQRRDIMYVELHGWANEPRRDDRIVIERWNEHGVGEEVRIAFDDLDPVDVLARRIKGEPGENKALWDGSFCSSHDMHFERPDHPYSCSHCLPRTATLAEDLAVLSVLARRAERKSG
jgi:hypothetical protein